MFILRPTVKSLTCPKCGGAMTLVRPNHPASRQQMWVCPQKHHVLAGFEKGFPGFGKGRRFA
jgi:hypothetical protein